MNQPDVRLSRRTLLTGGVVAIALSGCSSDTLPAILGGGSGATGAAPDAIPLATAEASAWIAAAGTTFYAGGRPMRLAGIELMGPAGGRPSGLRQQGFIAAFDLLDGASMAGDQLHTLSHASIPTFDIHLVNSGSKSSRMHASFN